MADTFEHFCEEGNAARFIDWVENRGGVALWASLYIGDGTTWSSPALDKEGKPYGKPNWKAATQPTKIFTSLEQIGVVTLQEVKRFKVHIRLSSNGLSTKLTDASNTRLNRELSKAGIGSTYKFDYETQEAVILKPIRTISLEEWKKQKTLLDEVGR